MKLLKCYIENFGKLHQQEFNFKDGLNIINEENGFGKTTFATFIKSMFYGLDIGTNVRTENSERKLYTPWQGGIYGGNIEFEIDGKQYKIERFFGKKQTEDTFKLYDLSTNLESFDYTENIGEEIFKINKNGYERSTYIPQGKIQVNMEDSISAKLGNVLESDNDINTSEDALKMINTSKKIYKKDKGRGGLIDEKIDRLNHLERELEKSESDLENLNIRKKKLENNNQETKQIEELKQETEALLSKKIEQDRKLAKLETYKTISRKYEEIQNNLARLKEFFENGIPQKFKNNDISEAKIDENIKKCYTELELEKQIQIKQTEKKNIQKEISKNKKVKGIFLSIGFILLILGLTLFLLKVSNVAGIILIITSIIAIITSFIIFSKRKNNSLYELNKEIHSLEEDSQKIENELNEFMDKYHLNKEDMIMSLTNLKSEYNSYHNLLEIKKTENANMLEQFELTKKEKEKFEIENNVEDLNRIEDFSNLSEQDLKNKIFETNKKIDILNDEKNQLKNQIEILENKIDENEYLEADIENLKEDINEAKEKYQILKKTEELLKEAKESFASNYLREMTDGFNRYLKFIDNKDLNTNVDINLDVKIDSNGAQKEIKYFSSGYKDLIYICMRFSLIEALFKNEKPFIIIDDPFVNLDEEKTSKALEILNEFANKYQVIYFVCNSSRI